MTRTPAAAEPGQTALGRRLGAADGAALIAAGLPLHVWARRRRPTKAEAPAAFVTPTPGEVP